MSQLEKKKAMQQRNGIKVFISYKRDDLKRARAIGNLLHGRGFGIYIDRIDPMLDGTDRLDVGDRIRSKLETSHQLLVVASDVTQDSWWVPWEIGVATEKGHRIATYILNKVDLPSFLRIWPVLRSSQDLTAYAEESKKARQRFVETASTEGFQEARHITANDFHRALKKRLQQED